MKLTAEMSLQRNPSRAAHAEKGGMILFSEQFMRFVSIVSLLVAIALFPQFALAWNETGHMTVALIAYRRLDDAQKQKIAEILRAHPHYKLYLTANVPSAVNADEWAFLRAATWPDFVRPPSAYDRTYKDPSITHFHHGEWHYVTIPFVPERDKAMFSATEPGSSTTKPTTLPMKPEPNILTAFDQCEKQLQSPDTKPEDRAVALCWVIHLIGDVHQPLHAASLYNATYPAGDKGGNSIMIRSEGGVMNLHAFWDDQLGTSDAYSAIDFLARELCADPTCDPTRNPMYQSDTSFSSWADESHEYAGSIAYLNGRLRGALWQKYSDKEITDQEVPALPAGYAANARDLSKQRVTLAGYRLANQLTITFKP